MKDKQYKAIILIFGSMLLIKCSPVLTVQTDYDREADFSEYRTFYWSDDFQNQNSEGSANEPLFYNTLVKKRLKQAIQRELEGKGYTISAEDPDLLVSSQVVVEERSTGGTNYPYSPFYFGYYGGFSNVATSSQKEGDVVINLIDRNQRQLVWQGYASGVLEMDTEDRQQEINDAVTMILSNYNHRAGS